MLSPLSTLNSDNEYGNDATIFINSVSIGASKGTTFILSGKHIPIRDSPRLNKQHDAISQAAKKRFLSHS
ncbi:MAG TPA: hypothetical protein VLR29_05270 [Flavobacterium sp.]|nr:hypothetical protein [Flavobacterium sp.]